MSKSYAFLPDTELLDSLKNGYRAMKVEAIDTSYLIKTIKILKDYQDLMGGVLVFDQESLGYRVTDKTNGTSFFKGTRTHIALTEISRRLLAYKMDQEFPEAVEEKSKRGRL